MKLKYSIEGTFMPYGMRIDFFTNRTFCEPNPKFDTIHTGPVFLKHAWADSKSSVGFALSRTIKRLVFVSNFWFGSQKVRFVKNRCA